MSGIDDDPARGIEILAKRAVVFHERGEIPKQLLDWKESRDPGTTVSTEAVSGRAT